MRPFEHCAHFTEYTYTHIHTNTSNASRSQRTKYMHINSQSTKPLFSLYLMDIVFLNIFSFYSLPLTSKPNILSRFCNDDRSLHVRFRRYYVNATSSAYLSIELLPSSFYNTPKNERSNASEYLIARKKSGRTTPKTFSLSHTYIH